MHSSPGENANLAGEIVCPECKVVQEIERKFFVAKVPEGLEVNQSALITQGYLFIMQSGCELRLRKIGARCWLSVKSGGDLTRFEGEIEINAALFEELWPATEGRRLEKTRYYLPHGESRIELDIYHGKLEGLILAEIEFKSVEESSAFVPPEWLGREVTADPRYKAKELVQR